MCNQFTSTAAISSFGIEIISMPGLGLGWEILMAIMAVHCVASRSERSGLQWMRVGYVTW